MNLTLVLNAGSSSLKFAVAAGRRIQLRGKVDHFGRSTEVRVFDGRRLRRTTARVPTLRAGLRLVRTLMAQRRLQPTTIIHRVVHGGQKMNRPTRLTPSVLRTLRQLTELAPLHQPANLMGVDFAQRTWPAAQQWGVFDTAIYRSLPVSVRTYPLPTDLAHRLRIEKYGFHGTSHAWAFRQAARKLHQPIRRTSAVTMHLGSGASMTLWHLGRPVDTTMGFTPLEGLMMATRSGDLDPAIPLYIQHHLGWSWRRVERLLERHAGLLGISGLSDMRDILGATGHPVPGWPRRRWSARTRSKSKLALEMYLYHLRRTLASYLGLYPGVRLVIFTGPIGENRVVQRLILRDLPAARRIQRITIPADEEQAIVDALHA